MPASNMLFLIPRDAKHVTCQKQIPASSRLRANRTEQVVSIRIVQATWARATSADCHVKSLWHVACIFTVVLQRSTSEDAWQRSSNSIFHKVFARFQSGWRQTKAARCWNFQWWYDNPRDRALERHAKTYRGAQGAATSTRMRHGRRYGKTGIGRRSLRYPKLERNFFREHQPG